MPYRIDISNPPHDVLDQLLQIRALDVEPVSGGLAAIIPDDVTPEVVVSVLGVANVSFSPAVARDNGSVWLLSPRTVRIGSFLIAPSEVAAPPGALRLIDSTVFGTGHHPTTALCIEAIQHIVTSAVPDRILDVGTGSGVLALAALMMGVPRAVGLDIDADALTIAAQNARLNNLSDRLQLVFGGPDEVDGAWPLIVANVLAAPLIEMAPALVRRIGRSGYLVLSGIPCSLESEVRQTYQRFGMRHGRSESRAGWTAWVAQASW